MMSSVVTRSTATTRDRVPAAAHREGEAWYAIWTRSHFEQIVGDQLDAVGFKVFLPKTSVWSTRRGVRTQHEVPLFPGYLFLRHAMNKESHVEVIKARGVVRVLGERWDRLETISDEVMEAVLRVAESGLGAQAHPHLMTGERVRVTAGPFQGLKGIFLRSRPAKGLFVLSIDLLQRSVAVEVESAHVESL
jgi:transcription termination/antitermination protein NusG